MTMHGPWLLMGDEVAGVRQPTSCDKSLHELDGEEVLRGDNGSHPGESGSGSCDKLLNECDEVGVFGEPG